jgi:thioredoxin-related protein
MKLLSICFAALVLAFTGASAADPVPGTVKGEAYSLPSWFKMSFLDFPAEVEQGKHVIVFMHLDNCPYCARMLKDNFVSGDNQQFMEKHFDVIAVNVEGSLEVKWTDGRTYTEKALARHLNMVGTPTIVFLNMNGEKVLQLTGYRDPRAFRRALDYVQTKSYTSRPFAAYRSARETTVLY